MKTSERLQRLIDGSQRLLADKYQLTEVNAIRGSLGLPPIHDPSMMVDGWDNRLFEILLLIEDMRRTQRLCLALLDVPESLMEDQDSIRTELMEKLREQFAQEALVNDRISKSNRERKTKLDKTMLVAMYIAFLELSAVYTKPVGDKRVKDRATKILRANHYTREQVKILTRYRVRQHLAELRKIDIEVTPAELYEIYDLTPLNPIS